MQTETFPVTAEVIMSFEDSNDNRFVLLMKNDQDLAWQLPATDLRSTETTLEAAQRVVREKINLNIDKNKFEFLNIYDDPKRHPRIRKISAVYFHFLDEVNSILVAKNSLFTRKRAWFNVNELPKLPFDHDKMIKEFVQQQYPIT